MNMQPKKYFKENPEDFHFFLSRREKDFSIHVIGYHNLNIIPAETMIRTQDYFTLHFVLSGEGFLHVGGKEYKIKPYDVFYLDNESFFSYYPNTENPWEYIFFEFEGDFAKSYINESMLSKTNPVVSCSVPQKLFGDFDIAFNGSNTNEHITYFNALSLFFSLLNSVSKNKFATKSYYENDFIEEVKLYIKMYYLTPGFTIEQLSKTLHISHSHLCRVFKAKEGISIASYIRKERLNCAYRLLATSNYSVRNIAQMSNFNEYEYFFRAFKQQFGETPSKIREKIRAEKDAEELKK